MTALSYHAIHQKLRRIRGRASDYPCRRCGETAREWSYNGADPDERIGLSRTGAGRPISVPYSLDLSFYEPLCRHCHRMRDPNHQRAKTHCVRGHEFTPENTYIQPGLTRRQCRACNRAAAGAYKARSRVAA